MKRAVILTLMLVVCAAFAMSAMGCQVQEYRVDYCGSKLRYAGAEDSYHVRQQVELYYPLIATDTDYAFYLDGEPLDFDYDDEKGYIIRFVMPPHDVVLECVTKNSMVYVPQFEEGTLLFDYYRGTAATADEGGYYELALYSTADPEVLQLCEYVKEYGEEEICTEYCAPAYVLDDCMEIVHYYEMTGWNELSDGVSTDGVKLVCKFEWEGEWLRVSNECMSINGEEAFDEICTLLQEYILDEYRAES